MSRHRAPDDDDEAENAAGADEPLPARSAPQLPRTSGPAFPRTSNPAIPSTSYPAIRPASEPAVAPKWDTAPVAVAALRRNVDLRTDRQPKARVAARGQTDQPIESAAVLTRDRPMVVAPELLVEEVPEHPTGPVDELGLLSAAPTPALHRRAGRERAGKGRRRPVAIVGTLAVISALVVGIFFGGRVIIGLFESEPAADYTGQGTGSVQIEVPVGAATVAIAEILVEADVIASAAPFVEAASANPDALGIQPGVYDMRRQMSGQAALDRMLDPGSRVFQRATIPEGYTVEQTLEALAEQSDIALIDFQAAAAAVDELGLPAWANGTLEGFLYPATYDIGPDSTATEILREMVAQFNLVALETGLEASAAAVGLTPYEVLTVASLVQSEVTVESERPKVARVIYNRLAAGIPLGIDAALAYELGISGSELTTELLAVDSPYNTRIRLGLPPTPISNPGEPSMSAALLPEAGTWLYYVLADADGTHVFTDDYEEFLAAKAECERLGLGCG